MSLWALWMCLRPVEPSRSESMHMFCAARVITILVNKGAGMSYHNFVNEGGNTRVQRQE